MKNIANCKTVLNVVYPNSISFQRPLVENSIYMIVVPITNFVNMAGTHFIYFSCLTQYFNLNGKISFTMLQISVDPFHQRSSVQSIGGHNY